MEPPRDWRVWGLVVNKFGIGLGADQTPKNALDSPLPFPVLPKPLNSERAVGATREPAGRGLHRRFAEVELPRPLLAPGQSRSTSTRTWE